MWTQPDKSAPGYSTITAGFILSEETAIALLTEALQYWLLQLRRRMLIEPVGHRPPGNFGHHVLAQPGSTLFRQALAAQLSLGPSVVYAKYSNWARL